MEVDAYDHTAARTEVCFRNLEVKPIVMASVVLQEAAVGSRSSWRLVQVDLGGA